MSTASFPDHMILTPRPTIEDLERIEHLLAQDLTNVDNLDWVAFMYYAHGYLDRALRYYVQLVELVPTNPSYRFFVADCHDRHGNRAQALSDFRLVVEMDPEGEYARLAAARLEGD